MAPLELGVIRLRPPVPLIGRRSQRQAHLAMNLLLLLALAVLLSCLAFLSLLALLGVMTLGAVIHVLGHYQGAPAAMAWRRPSRQPRRVASHARIPRSRAPRPRTALRRRREDETLAKQSFVQRRKQLALTTKFARNPTSLLGASRLPAVPTHGPWPACAAVCAN